MAIKLAENTDILYALKKSVQSLMGKDNTLEDLCLSLLELARIDVQLMESEEEDKKSISLLGLRDDVNPNAPLPPSTGANMSPTRYSAMAADQVVKLDKTCLSCTTQPLKIVSAFKMACLTYFPSPVGYQGLSISRLDLIETKRQLLNS